MTEPTAEQYADELSEELELRDVPVEAVQSIVAEVLSHSADSGEDPYEAFGAPRDYADAYAPRSRLHRFWWLIAAVVLLSVSGASLLISGIFGLLDPGRGLWGLSPWVRVALGAVGIAAFVGIVITLAVRGRRPASSWRLRPSSAVAEE
ncbi:MAG TPA: hypothetical protein VF642_06720 [Propionibacteriaceae bacterium]|jgi:hypothetical protein